VKGRVLGEAALLMSEGDTVATALEDLEAGRTVDRGPRTLTLAEPVAFGHKFALVAHDPGDDVRKYGEVIGRATERIAAGAWAHTHNVESTRGRGDLSAEGEST
jgi:altronate dehydratase small subunit